ncbi:MAG: hypothetical protein WA004_02025 [Saprospiraceae bacterium]
MNRFFISAHCSRERNAAISELEQVVGKHGFLIDFKFFSDISISMIIEMEEGKVGDLCTDLKEFACLHDFETPGPSSMECMVFLNITFTKGTGDKKIEVPEAPG